MKFYNIIVPPSVKTAFKFSTILFLFVFFTPLWGAGGLYAQATSGSPYSRFGVGDLQFGGFTKNLGMGGLSLSVSQPFNLNFSNPASYSALTLTSFEAAANASFYDLKTSTKSGRVHNESFGYFALGFPVKYKKAGISLGLLPYSNVGYDISSSSTNTVGDAETHKYEGSGGLNQFYVGLGWSPFKDFSVGANASFVFGTIDQVRRVEFPYNFYYNTKITESTIVNDFYYNIGVIKTFDSLVIAKSDSLVMFEKQKEKINDSLTLIRKILDSSASTSVKKTDSVFLASQRIDLATSLVSLQTQLLTIDSLSAQVLTRKQKSGWSFNAGATFTPSVGLKGRHTFLAQSYKFINTVEVVKDTAVNIDDKTGKLVLPLSAGIGLSLKQGTRWLIGTDFSVQNWKDYSLFGERDSLANSWRTSVGLQWIPDDRSNKSYFSLVQYRFGFHYEQTYLQLHNSQLNDMGVSLGFGFPMKKSLTTIQFAVEAGKRGTITDNLVEVNYVKCSLAFSLNDRWFLKPKFD